MSRKRVYTRIIPKRKYPIPPPPQQNLLTGLIFLAASFINNTDALDIEHSTKDSQFAIRYRGTGYEEHKRRR